MSGGVSMEVPTSEMEGIYFTSVLGCYFILPLRNRLTAGEERKGQRNLKN